MSTRNRICARAAATLLCLAGFSIAWADNNDLAKIGEEHLDAGRYGEAIKAFEKISETYENIVAVNFNLAWCYYLTENYTNAIPKLIDLSGPRTPNEASRLQSLFLLADSYARLAGQEDPESADRKKNIAKAIELHSEFIAKNPNNDNTPNAIYSRAYTYYIDSRFDKAEADLKTVMQKAPNKPVAKDAQYLLANVYSRQGMAMMKEGKPEEAKAFMEKARQIFKDLSKNEGNLAMANNSVFSLAQTWFNAEMYRGAIRYFREVRPKQEVLKDLESRLDVLLQQQAHDIGSGRGATPLKKDVDKLKAQLSAVKDSSDLMISAYLQIAVSYYKLHRYDEARIVCRHIIDRVRDNANTEKEQAYFLVISAYLEEKNPDAAATELEGFQATFGASTTLAESASLSIGQLFMMQGNVAKAAEQFAQSTEQYPNGKGAEEAFYLKFSAEYLLNQPSNAVAAAQAYMDKFPKGRYAPNALYLKGMSLAALNKWDEALATLDEILSKFPKKTDNFQAQDEVVYQKGYIYWQKAESLDPSAAATTKDRATIMADKKAAMHAAIKEFEKFTQDSKTSTARPAGLYYLGMALNAAGEFDKARTVLYNIHKEYPTNSISPAALYQVGAMYYARTNLTQMSKVLEELVQAYPGNPIDVDAYFFLGFIANKESRYDDAIDYLYSSIETAPDNPRAPECLNQTAQAYLDKAKAMGAPTILSDAKKAVYNQALLDSANSYEEILLNYPDTEQAQLAIPGIAESIGMLVRFQLLKEEQAADYYNKAIARRPDDPNLKARLLFSKGRYLLKTDRKEKALVAFNDALTANPDVVLSAEMLTDYAEALKDAKDLAKAETIYNKVIKDYPDNPRALAPAWFGVAEIKFQQGKAAKDPAAAKQAFEEARQYYEKVLKDYGWYEPGKQAKVRLAMIYEEQGQFEQAEKMFSAVWTDEKGEAKLGAMLGVARCQLARSRQLKKNGQVQDYQALLKVTDENLTKLIVLYETFDEYVAEALWLKGQAYDLVGDQAKARETYGRLVKQYPKSPWANPGNERLQQLGGPPAPAAGGQ